jgi:hypothetical protein
VIGVVGTVSGLLLGLAGCWVLARYQFVELPKDVFLVTRTLCRPAGEVQVPSRHRDRRRAAAQRHRQGAQARTRSQFVDADAPKIS